MEQVIYNGVLQIMQLAAAQQQAAPMKKTSESGEFRKLMEKQQTAAQKEENPEQPAVKEEAPQDDAAQIEVSGEPQIQEQMALAAMAVMRSPVVAQAVEPLNGNPEAAPQAAPIQPVEQALRQTAAQTVETMARQPEQTANLAPEQGVQANVMETAEAPVETTLKAAVTDKAEFNTAKVPEQTAERAEAGQLSGAQSQKAEAPGQETTPDMGGKRQDQQPEGAEVQVFKDVREIPVKVGETKAPATMEQTAKPVETQISEKLTQVIRSGETKVELQLEPSNLGRVSVELTWNSDGTLRVALQAENSQTRLLLEKDAAGLQSALMRNTQQEVQVEVPRQQESQQQEFYDERQNQERQNPQQHSRRERQQSEQDFLQQLRLGLIPLDGEAS